MECRSLMYIRKCKGPKIGPYGTLWIIGIISLFGIISKQNLIFSLICKNKYPRNALFFDSRK